MATTSPSAYDVCSFARPIPPASGPILCRAHLDRADLDHGTPARPLDLGRQLAPSPALHPAPSRGNFTCGCQFGCQPALFGR
jgi:hypothetical protein